MFFPLPVPPITHSCPFSVFLSLSLTQWNRKQKIKIKKTEKSVKIKQKPTNKKMNSLCFGKVLLNMELGISLIYPMSAKWGKLFFFCHHISFAEDFSVKDNALYQLLFISAWILIQFELTHILWVQMYVIPVVSGRQFSLSHPPPLPLTILYVDAWSWMWVVW